MENKIRFILENLESKKRGEKNIIVTKENAPEEVIDFIREVHGTDFLPDDFRYDTIHSILDNMLQYDCDNLQEIDHEIIDGLVSIYTHDLNTWLSSNLLRSSYCDDAQNEGLLSEESTMSDRIMCGQYQEISELYHNIVTGLDSLDLDELTKAV